MKKRKLVLTLFFVVMVASLIGCSGGKKSTENGLNQQGKTLNALFMKQAGYSEDDVKQITEEFMTQNPDIKVETTFVPYEALEQKILTSATSGGYDVVLVDAPWTAKFASAGLLDDVTANLTKDERKGIFKGALSAVTYQDKLYGMPWLNDTKYLFYNKQMLQDAGFNEPPKTWSELAEQAKVIKEKGIVEYPIVWSWAQAEALVCDLTSVTKAFGGGLVDKTGNPNITDAKNKQAVQFMVDTINNGLTNPKSTEFLEEDVRGMFSSGKAAFALNWTYMYNLANDPNESEVAGQVGIALSPGSSNIKSASVNGGMGLSITKGSNNKDASWEYIKFLSSPEVQKKYAKSALPIWKNLYDDQDVMSTSPEVVAVSKEQYDYLVNRPKVAWYGELSTELQVRIQEILLGNKSVDEGLSVVQKKAEELVKK